MLESIRIIEIEGLGPGPFAGMMLADFGAEVIVIHRPGAGSPVTGEASLLDRGKKSIVLDLKDRDNLDVAKALISSADGLIEGFRPGVMERLGLGPEVFESTNPRLVYGRMTGWGQDGPRSQTAGHDLNYIATSGALWYASEPGSPPLTPPTVVGDIGGGALYLVAGMLAGILNAARTGKGTSVDAAIVDGSAHMMALLMSMAATGNLTTERGNSLLDGPHWCRSYACADGRYLTVQCLEPKFYGTFLAVMGLGDDPAFAAQNDPAQWPDQTVRLAEIFRTAPAAHWVEKFEGTDACVAPVLSPDESKSDPHMMARGTWRTAQGLLQPSPAPRFGADNRSPGEIPLRGEHSADILDSLKADGLI